MFSELPIDLKLCVFSFNEPPEFLAGLHEILEWALTYVEKNAVKIDVKLNVADPRIDSPPYQPQLSTEWELFLSFTVDLSGFVTYKICFEHWAQVDFISREYSSTDYKNFDLIRFCPRELTSLPRLIISIDFFREQHRNYCFYPKGHLSHVHRSSLQRGSRYFLKRHNLE